MVETRKSAAKKAAAKKAEPKVDPYEGTEGPHKYLNLPVGGIETDEGGRPVMDEGGRPVNKDK